MNVIKVVMLLLLFFNLLIWGEFGLSLMEIILIMICLLVLGVV